MTVVVGSPYFLLILFVLTIFYLVYDQELLIGIISQLPINLSVSLTESDSPSIQMTIVESKNHSVPVILYWNKYFVKEFQRFIPDSATAFDCPFKCLHTSNRSAEDVAELRVFHERHVNVEDLPSDSPRAYNLLFTLEPPYLTYSKYGDQKLPPDYFHHFASYRTSTSIYYPYDQFVSLDESTTDDDQWTKAQIEEKLKLKKIPVLIAMSNCNSDAKRHVYVRELQKHIEITRVGACDGTIHCTKDPPGHALRKDMECMQHLNEAHYFYLAFENSVCPELLTEKFWRLRQLIVPIVLTRSVIPQHIPNDTFIAANDFESSFALAAYLKWLIGNPKEYQKYFEWTKRFRRTPLTEAEINVGCQLCKLAYENRDQQPTAIPNYKEYWSAKDCASDYAIKLIDNNSEALKTIDDRLSKELERSYRNRTFSRIV
ncbi:Alpha-(1,3)-fucosyltransferase C [Aphelenchoides besseyi]|nr:Alpha-(1,3)-fucosyltransferase C [Aphelenchoides besseyi]